MNYGFVQKNLVRYKNVHFCTAYDSEKLKTKYPIIRDQSNELKYIHSVEYFEIKNDVEGKM